MLVVVGAAAFAGAIHAQSSVDMGDRVPDAQAVKDGLFPEDACQDLEATGIKCLAPKAVTRFSLPAAAFRLGSADLPDLLRKQLDVFGLALRGRKSDGRLVRIEGHADASGPADAGLALSQRRADAVKAYLVRQGVEADLLQSVGMGAQAPRVTGNPYAADNRRIEIGRVVTQ
jgi:OmpA-OmpF porin, OOP family